VYELFGELLLAVAVKIDSSETDTFRVKKRDESVAVLKSYAVVFNVVSIVFKSPHPDESAENFCCLTSRG
jgi:hypothetical protein